LPLRSFKKLGGQVLSHLKNVWGLWIQNELVLVDRTGRETANPMRKQFFDAICIQVNACIIVSFHPNERPERADLSGSARISLMLVRGSHFANPFPLRQYHQKRMRKMSRPNTMSPFDDQ
jgi:hypothetical protein